MNVPHDVDAGLEGLLVRQIHVAAALCAPGDTIVAATGGFQGLFGHPATPGARLRDVLPRSLYREGRVAEQLGDPALDQGKAVRVRLPDGLSGGGGASEGGGEADGGEGAREFRVVVSRATAPEGARLVCVEEITGVVADEAAAQRARELTRLGALAATLAHEVRNPLAGISAAMQLVRRALPDGAPHAALLTRAQGEVARLNALVEELVMFARPVSVDPREVSVEAVARAAAEAAREALGEAAELRIDVEGTGRAWADEAVLGATLGALVRNAHEAGASRVLLRVAGRRVDVLDDGPGLAPEIAEVAFQPFTTTKTRGTGLGLANAYRALDAMGGRLEVVASPLGGAGFRVALRAPGAVA